MVIKKEEIGNETSLKIGGNLVGTSFNGHMTTNEAEAMGTALILASHKGKISGKDKIELIFGNNRKDGNGKMYVMVGFRE